MQTIKSDSLLGIYKEVIPFLLDTPEEIRSPRGQKVHEIIGAHIEISDPNCCIWEGGENTRPYPLQYLKDELRLYLSCTNSLDAFSNISKFWAHLSDDDSTINSAYGEIVYDKRLTNKEFDRVENYTDSGAQLHAALNKAVYTQFEWVMKSFEKDKDTRQAIMFVASPYYQYNGNKDFICTLNYHFIINSDNKLNMIVHRRSQDVMLGLIFDCPWEAVLQNIVLHEIKKFYPEVELGSYMLNCNSLHMYERNFLTFDNFSKDCTLMPKSLPIISDNYFMNKNIINRSYNGSDIFLNWIIN